MLISVKNATIKDIECDTGLNGQLTIVSKGTCVVSQK